MKKILLLLITIYSFSFAGWTGSNMTAFNNYGKSETTMKSCTGSSSTSTIVSTYTKASYTTYQSSMDTGTMRFSISNISFKPEGREGYWLQTIQGRLLTCNVVTKSAPISDTAGLNIGAETCWVRADGTFDCVDNPSNSSGFDDNENLLCNSGYSAVGNSQCFENPSNGYYDPYGEKQCNEGFYATGSSTMTNACMNTPYVPENNDGSCPSGWTTTTNFQTGQTTCLPPNYSSGDSGTGGTGSNGDTGGDTGTGGGSTGDTGTGSTGGTTVQNSDGSSTTTYPDGSSTTNYPDGTSTSSGSTGGTSGGSGTGGTGSGANTPSENNPTPETPYNPDPVANSCTDLNLTLQEKMLCELNQGMKNQNAESDPTNSLNNLLKDINSDNNKTGEAINKNIKSTNDNLATVNKNLVENNKNTQAMVAKQNASNVYLKNIDKNLSELNSDETNPDMTDLNGSSQWLNTIYSEYTTFYNNLKSQSDNFVSFADTTKQTITQGFTLDLNSGDKVSCPRDYIIDLSSLGQSNINFNVDFCEQTSKLRPYLYPFILIILFIAIIFFTISIIKGL
ncbi:hypothetical protein KKG81_03585 [bacterium]|nr:hypothetical protein [bacterium]